ncbi:hypothetical protein C2U55_24940 [Enterobacteriaceae bacterium ENNIH3]|nr:hypothetical protein C2U55_24940 [Enterobacteriaceae bacterium ENNIH3]AUV07862.1 hypothetical protein C2U52_17165 [Enterobacteriaceae bacterium ENNIH2]
MTVNGQDFYDFAVTSLARGDEIGFRNAVGRAYYGLYHDVCSKLQKCPEPATHVGVRDYLIETSWLNGYEPYDKMKLISLGTMLKHLHTQRKWADYSINYDYPKADAEAALIMARKGLEKSQAMLDEITPPAPAA